MATLRTQTGQSRVQVRVPRTALGKTRISRPADEAQWNYATGTVPMYRVGNSDRTIGEATGAPNGFTVVNLSNNKVFIVSGGVWTDGGTGTFPANILAAWRLS